MLTGARRSLTLTWNKGFHDDFSVAFSEKYVRAEAKEVCGICTHGDSNNTASSKPTGLLVLLPNISGTELLEKRGERD